jgi:Prokaryotic Cytochrome C oxidase subunit IV
MKLPSLLKNAADRAWLALVLATGATLWLGEHAGAWGPASAVLVLALAAFKGWLVVDEFMGLRQAPVLWRRLLLGWLLGVCALVGALHLAAG